MDKEKKNKKVTIKKLLFIIYMAFMSINFYGIFLYLTNIQEIGISELVTPLIKLMVISLLIFAFNIFIFKDVEMGILVATICSIVFSNYILIENFLVKIIPVVRYWHIIAILICLWLIIIALLQDRTFSICKDINMILGIVFIGLILLNTLTNVNDIITKLGVGDSNKNNQIVQENLTETANGETRNFYYLVFDEYSTIAFMEKYYGYDNSEFTSWLEDKGFLVSYSSRSETYDTRVVMANNVNLDYIVSNGDESEQYRKEGELFKIFESNGYTVQIIDSNSFYGRENPINQNAEKAGTTNEGFTFEDLILKNTPMYVFITSQNLDARIEELNSQIAFMTNPENFGENKTFTMLHIVLPHASFVFDENGNHVNSAHLNDWQDKKYYKEQYIYTTKVMQDIVDSILQNDENAVILLTSDHSARNLEEVEAYDKCQCFVAIYAPQSDIQNIEGESVVNILRSVVNDFFGTDYEMLERPQ